MDRNVPNGTLEEFADSAPPEAWLFAQAILDRPIPRIISPEARARAERERLEALAPYSRRHAEELCRLQEAETEARRTRESLEWAARIWPKCQSILDDLLRKEAEEREAWRRAEKYADELREGSWDASKHPRGGFSQNRGWWSPSGGSASATAPAVDAGPLRTTAFQTAQATAQVAGSSGAASPTWPMTGPASSWLPKVASAIDAAASAAGTLARALLGGLRNATMGAYWDRVPGAQAMPKIWAWELDKRVREGKLSREDAVAIFNTAVLGAEAQGFKPTGGTISAVHNSALDFLGKAEAVYFARKKKPTGAEGAADAERTQGRPERLTGEALAKKRREFERMKPDLWKEEAKRNPGKYTREQLEKMRRGEAPIGPDGHPMEIHHKVALTEWGENSYDNSEFMTSHGHRRGPNLKRNYSNIWRGRSQ